MTKEKVIYELDHSNKAVNMKLDKQYDSYLLGKAAAYDEALELVKEIDEPKQKWIPVSERLPKDCEEDWVLVQIKEKDCGFLWIPRVGEERNGKWWLIDDEKPLEDMFEVVAWQPLPEPYKAGEE